MGPESAAQPGENGDLLPPVRLGMQLGAREVGEGKARGWRVPLNPPSFSRGEENGMLRERPQERAALRRAVAATTNRCGREGAR